MYETHDLATRCIVDRSEVIPLVASPCGISYCFLTCILSFKFIVNFPPLPYYSRGHSRWSALFNQHFATSVLYDSLDLELFINFHFFSSTLLKTFYSTSPSKFPSTQQGRVLFPYLPIVLLRILT